MKAGTSAQMAATDQVATKIGCWLTTMCCDVLCEQMLLLCGIVLIQYTGVGKTAEEVTQYLTFAFNTVMLQLCHLMICILICHSHCGRL